MRQLTLLRTETSDEGTFSIAYNDVFMCRFVELPDRDNLQSVSCIPEGEYRCEWHHSPKFGHVYKVMHVPGRTDILIHAGNYAGDVNKGYKTDSYGCILPISGIGRLGRQRAGVSSRIATTSLRKHFEEEPFLLNIKWGLST